MLKFLKSSEQQLLGSVTSQKASIYYKFLSSHLVWMKVGRTDIEMLSSIMISIRQKNKNKYENVDSFSYYLQ